MVLCGNCISLSLSFFLSLSISSDEPVKQNVAVVSVLDLQQVADETIAGAALDEIPLCREKLLRNRLAKLLQEVVEQRKLGVLFDLIAKIK